jgi:protein-disulfide isomerase-like protein with CxxC motif
VRYITDPACPWSWAAEPARRRLEVEFAGELSWTEVMGGLARTYPGQQEDGKPEPGFVLDALAHWLDVAEASGAPLDPRLWTDGGVASSYPACLAVKAAADQGPEAASAYLRAVREGLMCFRRRLDTTEALADEARRAGLDVEAFRRALGSSATVEAFGADLEEARTVPEEARAEGRVKTEREGRERVPFPTAVLVAEDGSSRAVGTDSYEALREAAVAAGARPRDEHPDVLAALRRFGRLTTAEVEAVCDLPGPPAAAELWALARAWRVRPVPVVTGVLWEPA